MIITRILLSSYTLSILFLITPKAPLFFNVFNNNKAPKTIYKISKAVDKPSTLAPAICPPGTFQINMDINSTDNKAKNIDILAVQRNITKKKANINIGVTPNKTKNHNGIIYSLFPKQSYN